MRALLWQLIKNRNQVLMYSIFFFILVGCLPLSQRASAQSGTEKYVWYYLNPINVPDSSSTQTLSERASTEVKKVISAGHLAPFRTLYGEIDDHFFWYHNYDVVYTLSLVAPFLDDATKSQAQAYLKSEMQSYPIWSGTWLNPQQGTKREPDELSSSERGTFDSRYNNRPKLFAMYALWTYAQNFDDWAYIESNWNSIKSFYSTYRNEVSKYYSSIAGAIGMARLAYQKPTRDTASVTQALGDVSSGLSAGNNFEQFGKNAEAAYQAGSGGWDNWHREEMYLGFQFLDITPEIGRYIYDNASLKSAVLGSATNYSIYSLYRGESFSPLWYMAQAPQWSRYYGEGSGEPPDTKAMIFPLKAWVQKESGEQLRQYVDVGDALVGDFYYMQNTARTIAAFGQECWENLQTSTVECPASFTPICPTDINLDGITNQADYDILLTDFFASQLTNPRSDINKDDSVDLIDYGELVAKFLQACT